MTGWAGSGAVSGAARAMRSVVSRMRPPAATTPQLSASAVPVVPYRKVSPNIVMPTAAATTGFTTVSVASGAASPAPR